MEASLENFTSSSAINLNLLQSKTSQQTLAALGQNRDMVLPLYQLFDDIVYQQAFVEFLKDLVGLSAKPPTAGKKKEHTSAELSNVAKLQTNLLLLMIV